MGIYLRREHDFSESELGLARRAMSKYRDFYTYPSYGPNAFWRHGDNACIHLNPTQIQLDPKVAKHPAVYELIRILHPTHYLQDENQRKRHDLAELWGSNET